MRKKKKQNGKNYKKPKPTVLVLKLDPLLSDLKNKHYFKIGGTI